MSYVRIDYANGCYEYLKNDTPCLSGMRANPLLRHAYKYIRLRKMNELPEGKKCDKLYYTEKYLERKKHKEREYEE